MKEGGRTSCRVKCTGVLLTWMLPAVFNTATTLPVSKEPTALRDVVRLLRASADVQSSCKDIMMHAQVCKRLAGGSDEAVCFQICPYTWTEKQELKLHVHAFIKSNATDVRFKDLWCLQIRGRGSVGSGNVWRGERSGERQISVVLLLLLCDLREGCDSVHRGDKGGTQRVPGESEHDPEPRAGEEA